MSPAPTRIGRPAPYSNPAMGFLCVAQMLVVLVFLCAMAGLGAIAFVPAYRSPLNICLAVGGLLSPLLIAAISALLRGRGDRTKEDDATIKRRVFDVAPGMDAYPLPRFAWFENPLVVLIPRVVTTDAGCGEEATVNFVTEEYRWRPAASEEEWETEGSDWRLMDSGSAELPAQAFPLSKGEKEIEDAWPDFVAEVAELNKERYAAVQRSNYRSQLTQAATGDVPGTLRESLGWSFAGGYLMVLFMVLFLTHTSNLTIAKVIVCGAFELIGLGLMVYGLVAWSHVRREFRPDAIRARFDLALGLPSRAIAPTGALALFPVRQTRGGKTSFISERFSWQSDHWLFEGLADFEPALPTEFDEATKEEDIATAWQAYHDQVAHENQCLYDSHSAVVAAASNLAHLAVPQLN